MLVQPLQDACPRRPVTHCSRRRARLRKSRSALFSVVLVPGLTERLLDARVQMLGQALDDVTALEWTWQRLDGGGHT